MTKKRRSEIDPGGAKIEQKKRKEKKCDPGEQWSLLLASLGPSVHYLDPDILLSLDSSHPLPLTIDLWADYFHGHVVAIRRRRRSF